MVSFRTTQTSRLVSVIFACILCVVCALALGACSSGGGGSASKTVQFTDSCGRTVEIPSNPQKVAPSGAMAQQVIMTFDPKVLCGLSGDLTADEEKCFGIKSADYKVFGALYGTKGSFNKEEVVAAGTELVIDIGEAKQGIVEDLDKLQESLGIPVIHIEATIDTYDQVYTTLGKILGNEKRASELANYCKKAMSDSQAAMSKVPEDKRVSVAFLTDETHGLAQGSFHAALIDMVAKNAIVADNVAGSGFGNEISLEQLAVWNPDVLLIQSADLYAKVADDPAWSSLSAVQSGKYYLVPSIPYGWLNSPPSVNQVLGAQWLPHLLYPELVGADAKDIVKNYFETMYGYKISDAEYAEITKNCTPAQKAA